MIVSCFDAAWKSLVCNMEESIQYCRKCGKELSADEVAVTKKLINRGTTVFFCLNCLAESFEVHKSDIEKKLVYFKEMGCTLFS